MCGGEGKGVPGCMVLGAYFLSKALHDKSIFC